MLKRPPLTLLRKEERVVLGDHYSDARFALGVWSAALLALMVLLARATRQA